MMSAHSMQASASTFDHAQSTQAAIVVNAISKRYGNHHVLKGLSFEVQQGNVFALLGPNGAGKTTTVETLEGYRTADSGSVRVLGLDPVRDAQLLKPRIGVMLQQDALYPALTVREVLRLFSGYYATPQAYEPLLERLGLSTVAKKRCRYLSGGQKRRLALALALLGNPSLLFLDEPTAGMDPQASRATLEILTELKHQGVTLVLTTHLMQEAEQLADQIAIIDHGQLIALDTPQNLLGQQSTTIRLTTTQELDPTKLQGLPAIQNAQAERTGKYILEARSLEAVPTALVQITGWLQEENIPLTQLSVGHGSLEDLFLRLTGAEVRE